MNNRQRWEIELERRKMLQEEIITEKKKERFINEINNGLGEEIMSYKDKPKLKKNNLWTRIKILLGWN